MNKLISIDLFADFGMLKKPDTNEPVYLTFNMLHKPALLGILGAIAGLEGFKEKGKLPEYYLKLKDLQVGIQPINHEKGNFQKTTIKYNNATGFANKDDKNNGATLNIVEQTLVTPAFRCYLYLDTDNELQSTKLMKIYRTIMLNIYPISVKMNFRFGGRSIGCINMKSLRQKIISKSIQFL